MTKRRCFTLSLLLSVMMLWVASTSAWGGEPRRVAFVEGISEYRLEKNGLRVVLLPDSSAGTLTVNMVVFTGSRHERSDESGVAHMVEHMLFKGTPTNKNICQTLERRGAMFGATTSFDRTEYSAKLPATSENLETVLRLEADRLVNAEISDEDLQTEKKVVLNEVEMRGNSAGLVLHERIFATAYHSHNYGRCIAGNRQDIEGFTPAKLRQFYQRYYRPDNAMVIVAGKFDEKEALQLTKKYFGDIPTPSAAIESAYAIEPAQDGERVVVTRGPDAVGLTALAYHIPASAHPDFPVLQVLSSALSERLQKKLVDTQQATAAGVGCIGMHDPGLLIAHAVASDKDLIRQAHRDLLKLVEEFKKDVDEADVNRVKQQYAVALSHALDDSNAFVSELVDWAAVGDWRLFFVNRDRIKNVTLEDVKKAAGNYLRPYNRTSGWYVPTTKMQPVAIPETPPIAPMVASYNGGPSLEETPEFEITPENIDARTIRTNLSTGLKVVMLPKPSRGNLMNLVVTLRYGNAKNLKGLDTVCHFLPRLMLEGTKQMTREQLEDACTKNHMAIDTSGGVGFITFYVQVERDHIPAALDVLRQVMREPAFPLLKMEVMRNQAVAMIQNAKTDPGSLVQDWLDRQFCQYSKDDVLYEPSLDEAIARCQRIEIDGFRALHERFLGAEHGEIAVVGDFDPNQLLPQLESIFTGWKAKEPFARIPENACTSIAPDAQTIMTPGKPNAMYGARLELPIGDSHADVPALLIGNYIFGGGQASRLWVRVREKDGLSYHVQSSFNADNQNPVAQFDIQAMSSPADAPRVAMAVREELARLLSDGISDEELAHAKNGMLHLIQHLLQSGDAVLVNLLANTLRDGETIQGRFERADEIEALTAGEVVDALRRHISPDRLVVVTAGDFKTESSQPAIASEN